MNYNFIVVKNDNEQYSIWPEKKDLPQGWHKLNISGSKEKCLEYIESVWIDLRPLSLRSKGDS